MPHAHLHLGDAWRNYGSTFGRGYAFLGSCLLDAEGLANHFDRMELKDYASALAQTNGFFAVVRARDKDLVLVVDRISSIPLSYATQRNELYVSDDAYWVAEQLPQEPCDPVSAYEFLLLAQVTGRDTLHPRVKQLLPAQVLRAEELKGKFRLTTIRYDRYLRQGYFAEPKESLFVKWDEVLKRVFERLICSVGGRNIVIPLSAGYDSRLIGIMLKRLGYENVTCFSYGVPGNLQSRVSCGVAKALGFHWKFIPYNHESWYNWFHSQIRKSWIRYADGLASVPLVQDWPAIWEMKRQRVIPENSVFVSGHSMGFIAGTVIPPSLMRANRISIPWLARGIETTFYNIWNPRKLENIRDWELPVSEISSKLRKKIESYCEDLPCRTPEEAANVFEYFLWNAAMSKYFVNTLRGYEFLGYDWRLPFWDAEVMAFWKRMPLQYRLGKNFYISYVEKMQGNFGVKLPVWSGSTPFPQRRYLTRLMKATGLIEPLMNAGLFKLAAGISSRYRKLSFRKVYQNHPLAWFGVMPVEQFGRLYSRGPQSVYSLLAAERLGIISF